MTLWVDLTGMSDEVFADLYALCGQDGGLGEVNVDEDPTVARVTYSQSVHKATSDRLNTLVNTNYPEPIVITGYASSGTFPDGNPASNNGFTFIDRKFKPTVIRVCYDTQQCNGAGVWAVGTDGSHIVFPTTVMLYHELSHAYRIANNTWVADIPIEEAAVITDENVLRAELGIPLRDIHNRSGGCGGPTYGNPWGDCFLVSATYQSEQEIKIHRLRVTRDLLLRRSTLGQDFFNQLYREYYTVSPRIAVDMRHSPALLRIIKLFLVDPLLDFYELVQEYCIRGWKDNRFVDEVAARLDVVCAELTASGVELQDADVLARGLAQLATGHSNLIEICESNGAYTSPKELLCYLSGVLNESWRPLTLVQWALLTPLAAYWSLLAHALADKASISTLAKRLTDTCVNWLSQAPISYSSVKIEQDLLTRDLEDLAAGVFANPIIRTAIGTRLLERYKASVEFDLWTTLKKLDYTPACWQAGDSSDEKRRRHSQC